MASSNMTSPSIRTLRMKANDLNYMSGYFRGHSITGLGFRGHTFHPNMASKKLKSQKNLPNPKVELRIVPIVMTDKQIDNVWVGLIWKVKQLYLEQIRKLYSFLRTNQEKFILVVLLEPSIKSLISLIELRFQQHAKKKNRTKKCPWNKKRTRTRTICVSLNPQPQLLLYDIKTAILF